MSESKIKKLRVTNITSHRGSAKILDPGEGSGHKTILNGRSIFIDADPKRLPPPFDQWAHSGLISVHDADDGSQYHGPISSGELTRVSMEPVQTLSAQQLDLDEDDVFGDPDLGEAIEARVPTQAIGAHSPDLNQQSKPRITLGLETEKHSGDISPIPGDRPRSVDNSGDFTVRAASGRGR